MSDELFLFWYVVLTFAIGWEIYFWDSPVSISSNIIGTLF